MAISAWPEIMEALAPFPGLQPPDRPDIIDRVFKMKLNLLMDDIEKHEFFGPINAGNNLSTNVSREIIFATHYVFPPQNMSPTCSCLHN